MVPPQPLIKALPELFAAKQEPVRENVKKLTARHCTRFFPAQATQRTRTALPERRAMQAELAGWLGAEAVQGTLLDKMPELMRKDLEKLLAEAPGGRRRAQRFTRREAARRPCEAPAAPADAGAQAQVPVAAATAEEDRDAQARRHCSWRLCKAVAAWCTGQSGLSSLCATRAWTHTTLRRQRACCSSWTRPSGTALARLSGRSAATRCSGSRRWHPCPRSAHFCVPLCLRWVAATHANLRSVMQVAPGDFGDVLRELKKIIVKDSNVVCVAEAVACLGRLARGLRRDFAPSARAFFSVLLDKYKDKNSNICTQCDEALGHFIRCCP